MEFKLEESRNIQSTAHKANSKPDKNLIAFFQLLYEWDLKDNEAKKKEIQKDL
jgi:hypothetical protein